MNASAGREPLDILIVEDSRTQAEQVRLMLMRHGFESRVARDGTLALTLLRQQRPLLVISDVNMPEMNGYELCRRIRADPLLADMPVILLTSLSDPEDVVRGLESGADNFVIKPPDETYLLTRIRYILANRHLRSSERTRIAIEFELGGNKHLINADRLQMLHLLLSTYESAIQRGKQLAAAQEELQRVNERLEEKVRDRTAALAREIEEKTQLLEQLRRTHRIESLGRLASGIAHDLNNILAPILMGAHLLRSGLPPVEHERIIATVETSAQRGAALVRQLLIFGRGVEGERRPVNVTAVIGEVLEMCRRTFPKRIAFVTDFAADIAPVHGDATQLNQVLLNLCVNARDAMSEGGELSIIAGNVDVDHAMASLHADAKPGRHVVLRVADTGSGIAPEIMDRIFDPFFTTKNVGEGTGLGLSTVLGIVRSHGGFLRLDSNVGRGTVFEIFLPAGEIDGEASGTEDTPAEIPLGQGQTVLVVDDEESIRSVVRDTLARHNYRVVIARDGVEATAVCGANPHIDLVVTDLDMPTMNGVDLGRVLRSMNPGLRIVVSTGSSGLGAAERRHNEIEKLGVGAVLSKPYSARALLHAVYTSLANGSK